MSTQELLDQIKAIATAEDMNQVRAEIEAHFVRLTPEVQQALLDKLEEITAQSKQAREGAIATLKMHGVDYPLTDWLTPDNYAKKFELPNAEMVFRWINRGMIQAENIKEIPELDLLLVRAIEYENQAQYGFSKYKTK